MQFEWYLYSTKYLKCKGDTSPLYTFKGCDIGGGDNEKCEWAYHGLRSNVIMSLFSEFHQNRCTFTLYYVFFAEIS